MNKTIFLLILAAAFNNIVCHENDQIVKLMKAANKGNITKLEAIISSNPDLINAQDSEGKTALMHAAISRKDDAISLLINLKCDLNINDYLGNSALVYVLDYSWQDEKIELLLRADPTVNNDSWCKYFTKIKNPARLKQLRDILDRVLIDNDKKEAILKKLNIILKEQTTKFSAAAIALMSVLAMLA